MVSLAAITFLLPFYHELNILFFKAPHSLKGKKNAFPFTASCLQIIPVFSLDLFSKVSDSLPSLCLVLQSHPLSLPLPQDQPIPPWESHYISITNAINAMLQTMFYSRRSIKNESRCLFDLTWRMNYLRSNANCC